MSKYICKDCGTGFAVRPPRDCPACSSGNIAIEADSVPEKPSEVTDDEYLNKMLRHLLTDLCEKVFSGPDNTEYRDKEIERTMVRIRAVSDR